MLTSSDGNSSTVNVISLDTNSISSTWPNNDNISSHVDNGSRQSEQK